MKGLGFRAEEAEESEPKNISSRFKFKVSSTGFRSVEG